MLIALKIRNPATMREHDAADSIKVLMIETAPPVFAERKVGSVTTARPPAASVTSARTEARSALGAATTSTESIMPTRFVRR